jgi:glucose/arabinose dehydrogenase
VATVPKVVRAALVCVLIPLSLAAVACGEKDEPEVSGPPVVTGTTPEPDDDQDDTGELPPTGDGDGGVGLEEIGEFASPVFLAQPEGEQALYVVEQEGRIMRVGGKGRPKVFLDITGQVESGGSEQGLLSMAFDPGYRRNGLFYVHYTNNGGDTRVVEYRKDKGEPRPTRTVLGVPDPYPNHNGGLLLFDRDGNLLIGIGDGGGAGDPERSGQDLSSLLGKILRVDPGGPRGYDIPGSNPFAGERGARPEILVYGLRNPWRFSFDRETGDLWIGDVGQNEQEEIDALARGEVDSGANFGWSAFEGTARYNDDEEAPNAIDPVLTYGRDGGCSVTGGYVVRDPELRSLYGRYLYADFCAGQLRSFSADEALEGAAQDDKPLGVQVPSVSSFAEDNDGHVYALSLDGPVYRLVPERD